MNVIFECTVFAQLALIVETFPNMLFLSISLSTTIIPDTHPKTHNSVQQNITRYVSIPSSHTPPSPSPLFLPPHACYHKWYHTHLPPLTVLEIRCAPLFLIGRLTGRMGNARQLRFSKVTHWLHVSCFFFSPPFQTRSKKIKLKILALHCFLRHHTVIR